MTSEKNPGSHNAERFDMADKADKKFGSKKHGIPDWIRPARFDRSSYLDTLAVIESCGLDTVCKEANCPNRYECFSQKTATFLVLGPVCTRDCLYCNVKKGSPSKVDQDEPQRIAFAAKKLGLYHVVITSVTRDDLPDGGASHLVSVVGALRKTREKCSIELLIPDLKGDERSLKLVVAARPDIINHNIEVVEGLFSKLRPMGNFQRSLALLKKVKDIDASIKTKSGLMIGFGETIPQIIDTLKKLKEIRCDIVTIGQYLQPSSSHAPVERYYTPAEFDYLEKRGYDLGLSLVRSGPLVRSSYAAHEEA